MSINHYANSEINPLLDAYVKDIDVDTLEFDTLSIEDIEYPLNPKDLSKGSKKLVWYDNP